MEMINTALLWIAIFTIIINWCVYIHRKNKLKYKEIIIRSEFNVLEADQIMADLASKTLAKYVIENISNRGVEYISTEMETQMIREVSALVAHCLSEDVKYKLGMYYNEEVLLLELTKTVYTTVTEYVVQFNSEEDTISAKKSKEELMEIDSEQLGYEEPKATRQRRRDYRD